MNCLVHRARMIIRFWLFLYFAKLFFFHYYVSLCRIHLSLNNNKVYALPIVGLHALPNSPHILTVYKHTSVDAHRVTRPIELVLYTHSLRENYSLVKLVQETSIRESDCPGNVCKASFLHRMLVSVWDVQNIKQQMTAVELRCLHVRMVIIQWTRSSRLINSWKIRPFYPTLVSYCWVLIHGRRVWMKNVFWMHACWFHY